MRFDKSTFRKEMEEKINQEHEKKSRGNFKTIFNQEVRQWREKAGDNILDVIPYHAGSRDPDTKEGKWAYRLPVFVHRGVGINEDTFICLNSMYRKPCPICEYRKKLKDKGIDWKIYKKYFPQKRSLFNVWVQSDDKEYKKGVQIWDISDWLGYEKITPIAKTRSGDRIYYMEPDKEQGKSIAFRRKEVSKGHVEYSGYQLLDRDYDISEDIMKEAYIIDEVIYEPSYDEVAEAFNSTIDENGNDVCSEETVNKEELTDQYSEYSRSSRVRESSGSRDSDPERGFSRNSETSRENSSIDGYSRGSERSVSREEIRRSDHEPERTQTGCPYNFIFGSDFDLMPECIECKAYKDCQEAYNKRIEQRKSNRNGSRR